MSALDLTEASRAVADTEVMQHPTLGLPVFLSYEQAERVAAAAAPIIAAQVHEQIIETLHTERDEITGSRGPQDEPIAAESAFLSGLDHAIEVIKDGAS